MLAEDEDQREIRRVSKTVESWDDALALLDQQGWLHLDAIHVHPEFRERVLKVVVERLGTDPKNARQARTLARALRHLSSMTMDKECRWTGTTDSRPPNGRRTEER